MMEKALMIIMFMYAVSFSTMAGQYVIADVMGITLTNFEGDPIESHILTFVDEGSFNTQTQKIQNGTFNDNTTYYDKVETFTTAAASVAWELVTLLSGTYIFNFLYLMGVPAYFVSIFVILYVLLLARAIIGYIRGI